MNPAFWRERRVFVTGHTGFKGAWLCLLLHRLGARVTGYALRPPTDPSLFQLAQVAQLVDSIEADVRDLRRLSDSLAAHRPEIILHMAAQSIVLRSYEDPVETYSTNVMGTVALLEGVRSAGLRAAVVNVTTDKCYENRGWYWGYRETDTLGGRDPYSNSKACSELVARAWRHSYFPEDRYAEHGVVLACARAGNVIGGGDWTPSQLVPAVIAAFQRGDPVVLRHPAAVRPWQHVLDCLAGYLRLAQALVENNVLFSGEWNFGPSGSESLTVSEVVEALAGHWKVERAWTQATGQLPHEELELRLDTSKSDRLLRWRGLLTTAEALDWTAHWYRAADAGEAARTISEAQIDDYLQRCADEPLGSDR